MKSFLLKYITIVITGEEHKRGKGSLQHVNWLSERLLEKISELLIDKEEGGGGEERLLWEKCY